MTNKRTKEIVNQICNDISESLVSCLNAEPSNHDIDEEEREIQEILKQVVLKVIKENL